MIPEHTEQAPQIDRKFTRLPTVGETEWERARDERYRLYRRLWDARPRDLDPGPFPLHLDIETTNYCNLRCVMCPRTRFILADRWAWSPQGLGRMDFDLYRQLIDEAAREGAFSVKLNLLGEPLLHPQVVEQVEYAHRAGLYVMMNTNVMALTEALSRRLLQAGLDDLFFSVDSSRQEAYERIRPGARFETVLENIRTFVRLKREMALVHVRTRASMVTDVTGPTGPGEIEAYRDLMRSLGVEEVGFGPGEDGSDHRAENARVTGFVCEQLFQRLFVTWDGVILPCCGHWERGLPIARTGEMSLKQAWNNQVYRTIRRAHSEGRFMDVAICRNCHVPSPKAPAQAQGEDPR